MNTKIEYLYRDASNYKTPNSVILKGKFTSEQISTILSCCQDGEYFISSEVGLEEIRNFAIDLEVDHPYFELQENSFMLTNQPATTWVTPDELVAAFLENKEIWEEKAFKKQMEWED